VVDAGISVFVIFDPTESYVEAYFEPAAVQRLRVGMKGSVRRPGSPTRWSCRSPRSTRSSPAGRKN
jgi:multidrug resistance efflux pump